MGTFRFQFGSRGSDARMGVGGRIGLSIFLLLFAAVGCFFAYMLIRDFGRNESTHHWTQVPCQIVESNYGMTGRGGDYTFSVRYRYAFDAASYTSGQYALKQLTSEDFETIQRAMIRFSTRAEAVCWVDPTNPASAVLRQQTRLAYLAILLPAIFMLFGFGGLYLTWRGARSTPVQNQAVSINSATKAGRWAVVAFGAIFFLVGCGVTGAFSVPMVMRAISSRSWNATPATVISSFVRSHSGKNGATYNADILYRYEIGGKTYLSNSYDLVRGSSSGYQSKQQLVAQFPPGKVTTAYVNPADPVVAVLDRSLGWKLLLGLLPLIFVFIGAIVMAIGFKSGGATPSTAMPSISGSKSAQNQFSSAGSRRGKFITLLLFTLFWNGITWGIAAGFYYGGERSIFPFIFIGLFALIGLAMVGATIHSFLALFNPVVELTLSAAPVKLGDTVKVKWTCSGRYDRIMQFNIRLEGREEARYRRGTSTITDKNTFHQETLVQTARQVEIARGEVQMKIPANTMHTFEANSNKILWQIVVHGEIPNWPDVKDEFPVVILP